MRKILSLKSCLFLLTLFSFDSSFCQTNAEKSVLAEGGWFKVKITNTGLYKVSYDYLNSIGYPVGGLKSDQIKLYGNSTGLLPFKNDIYRPDDLVENALIMNDGGDGNFGPGDYFLFYAKGADTWFYDNGQQRFEHIKHIYDNFSFFFLTKNDKAPRRSSDAPVPVTPAVDTITEFSDYAFYEHDKENLIKSGRRLYGEKFNTVESYSFDFNYANVVLDKPGKVRVTAAMTATAKSFIEVKTNGAATPGLEFDPIGGYAQANYEDGVFAFNPQDNNRINLKIVKGSSASVAWLDFIEINLLRRLSFVGTAMEFRSVSNYELGNTLHFKMQNGHSGIKILDISKAWNPEKVQYNLNGSEISFNGFTDTLHDYIAYTGSDFPAPTFVSTIGNQNLHGLTDVDMVILTHPDFYDQAERLANLHKSEGLNVVLTTPDKVYNEFSSGARDITAIKDFMKHLYFKPSNGHNLKYLLLFGDGSYINKDYDGNSNFLPTYQSLNSENLDASFVSDDYFGFLDVTESENPGDKVDIGIGRLTVSNYTQATQVVDKIMHYVSTGYDPMEKSPFGDWRNKVLFVADDLSGGDGSIGEDWHEIDSDHLAGKVDDDFHPYFTDKIYMDAYKQISTPGGQRYPEAAAAFRNKVQQGALIVNYTGHGGEVGLAHERVLDISTITGWTNLNALPLFVTATCEFSRFDDPDRTSAGEMILLNPRGGGIGLLSTTRLVYSAPNFTLNNYFYDYALPDSLGNSMTIGEITKLTKQKAATPSFHNHMNFMLIADPALRLAYPKNKVITTKINGVDAASSTDTIKAFSKVIIEGEVHDANGRMTGFNGVLDVSVLDKPEKITTLGNDSPKYFKFELNDKTIYKGKASVTEGKFSFEFIVSKDISLSYGKGTILYYANNGVVDANGGTKDIIVGGVDDNPPTDNQAPKISLFINNEEFDPGDITDENPILLAYVSDDNGINTTGNGIGHEILATLDENTENAIVLDNYYEADLDTYKSGKIEYPYFRLDEGHHTLTVKVWDINNNSASATTSFVVANAEGLKVENLMNFPNPVSDVTTFYFEHNQAGKDLKIGIEIFDSMGKKITSLQTAVNEEGYQSKSIRWDSSEGGGNTIAPGIYVYRLTVSKADGSSVTRSNRLLLVK